MPLPRQQFPRLHDWQRIVRRLALSARRVELLGSRVTPEARFYQRSCERSACVSDPPAFDLWLGDTRRALAGG